MKHLSCLLSALFALTLCASGEGSALIFASADGRDYTPLTMGDKKAVVLCFVSPYCPTASSYIPEMNRIAADYSTQASFYFVHSDPDQKLPDILQHTELMSIKVPVLLDKDQRLVKLVQAKITPEVVVLSPDGRTVYQGRINDLYLGPTKKQRKATTRDLRDALDAIQKGVPVANAKTEAVGCRIGGLATKPSPH